MPDHVSLWGLLIPIRRSFQQYVNLRPVRLLAGRASRRSPAASPATSTSSSCARTTRASIPRSAAACYEGTDDEIAMQETIFTRRGIDRIMRYAFELAQTRPAQARDLGHQVQRHHRSRMPYWDERFAAIATDYPDVETDQYHIDILTAHFVRNPDWFDVVVGSQPVRRHPLRPRPGGHRHDRHRARRPTSIRSGRIPSMFEPVHGSAPDIAGQGHRQPDRPDLVRRHDARPSRPPGRRATPSSTRSRRCSQDDGPRTPDMGGKAMCTELGNAIVELIK